MNACTPRSTRTSLRMALRFALFAAAAALLACGPRTTQRLDPPDTADPELTRRYEDAVAAVDAGRMGDARGRLEKLAREAAETPLAPYVELQLGRVDAAADPIRGMHRLQALAKSRPDSAVGREAARYGGLAAAEGRQCLTARKLLRPRVDDEPVDAAAARALAGCEKGLSALTLLDRAARADAERADEDRAQAETIAGAMNLRSVAEAVEALGEGPLALPLARRLAELARAADDRKQLAVAMRLLPDGDPQVEAGKAAARRAPLGIILPLSGRSRPLGQDLKALFEGLYPAGEDRPEGPDLRIKDGGKAEAAAAAVRALVEAGVFAAAGVFDSTTAPAAARAAAEAGLPLVMLTLSDAPLRADGPVWRALHTPALVVNTAAGVGLAAGGKVAAVARGSDAFGQNYARMFAAAWTAGGGRVIGEIAWNPKKADYAAVARQLAGAAFDTLFVPADPTEAAQLMRHLAAAGIWARGAKARFEGEKGVREVRVIGTPSWYTPELPRLGGRYVQGVRVPVPYAAEAARGAPFAERVSSAVGRAPTAFDALLADAIAGLEAAWARHLRSGDAPAACIEATGKVKGVGAGLDFGERDALPALFVVEVHGDGFRLAK